MLSEKIGLEVDLFEVPDRKFGSYEKTGPKVSTLALRIFIEKLKKNSSSFDFIL